MLTSLMRIALTRSFKPFVFTGGSPGAPDYSCIKLPGLYVHIPFCRSICSFCPYCKQLYDAETAKSYAEALLSEIDLVCGNTGVAEASSLYFGGGTPALMLEYIPLIIEKLSRYFIITGGIGAELHPDDILE